MHTGSSCLQRTQHSLCFPQQNSICTAHCNSRSLGVCHKDSSTAPAMSAWSFTLFLWNTRIWEATNVDFSRFSRELDAVSLPGCFSRIWDLLVLTFREGRTFSIAIIQYVLSRGCLVLEPFHFAWDFLFPSVDPTMSRSAQCNPRKHEGCLELFFSFAFFEVHMKDICVAHSNKTL